MIVTKMRKAGEITQQFEYTDEELKLAIDGTELALNYLEGKGLSWALATTPLRQELEQLLAFEHERERNKTRLEREAYLE